MLERIKEIWGISHLLLSFHFSSSKNKPNNQGLSITPLQEEIREVFDGSCRLIPIKVVSDECIHLANDFIPELIDTLASQMNPQVVCATAGLCNSVAVDRLLREYQVWTLRRRKFGISEGVVGHV